MVQEECAPRVVSQERVLVDNVFDGSAIEVQPDGGAGHASAEVEAGVGNVVGQAIRDLDKLFTIAGDDVVVEGAIATAEAHQRGRHAENHHVVVENVGGRAVRRHSIEIVDGRDGACIEVNQCRDHRVG